MSDSFDLDTLQPRLEAMFAGVKRKHVVVAVSTAGAVRHAVVSSGFEADEDPREWTCALGCVVKLFTATLVLDVLGDTGVALDDSVAGILACADRQNALAGVTIRHLLEHTHGIAGPAIDEAPRRADGCIDVERLLKSILSPRRWPAGALYSYGDVGPWLAAAIVERLAKTRYLDAFERRLLGKPAGSMPDEACVASPVCASRGGGLALKVKDMTSVLARVLGGGFHRGPLDGVTPLPGWSVMEKGIHLGWKHFGEGWFGHNSVVPGASLLARIHTESRTAVIVASGEHSSVVVAAKLFGRWLPELRCVRIPKPLPRESANALDLESFCGDYASGARRISIRLQGGGLVLTQGGHRFVLAPAPQTLFLARPPTPGQPAYVQLLHPAGRGFRYLWDGRELLDNLRATGEARRRTS